MKAMAVPVKGKLHSLSLGVDHHVELLAHKLWAFGQVVH
jgi:hypothetical protein